MFNINNTLMQGITAFKEAGQGNFEPLHNMLNKHKKERLSTDLFMLYVIKRKKAKKRGQRRVERNYINICKKYGVEPIRPLTEDEREKEEYNKFYY